MTFLELVQKAERESGTVGSVLSTVVDQTGRHLKFVNWVTWAWQHIQGLRSDWGWLRDDFSGDLAVGVTVYDAPALGISTRFRDWVVNDPQGYDFTAYVTADGQSTEGYIQTIGWDQMRRTYRVGSNLTHEGKPVYASVSPRGELVIWPVPDQACTLRGEYIKAPQELATDDDIPELPITYHDMIVWRALLMMGEFDEAAEQNPAWFRRYKELEERLLGERTPRVDFGGPLA